MEAILAFDYGGIIQSTRPNDTLVINGEPIIAKELYQKYPKYHELILRSLIFGLGDIQS